MSESKKGLKVLDSWALLAYFEGQEAGTKVRDLLKQSAEKGENLLLSVVNWGEVLYTIEARYDHHKRDEVEHLMDLMHLDILDTDKDLARKAAELKARTRLPYADCFAASLAFLKNAELITGDKDFEKVEKVVKIFWL